MVTQPTASTAGTIYVLHFDRPYRHAKHYTGWTRYCPICTTTPRTPPGEPE